jgi:hypothetical protein
MPQVFKVRKARIFCLTVVVLLAGGGSGGVAPAWSLSLPLETPTVPVQAPAPPVKAPSVPATAPTVPTPSVKTPTVPPKSPTVPVKAPSVPVRTTTSAKTPSIPAKTPPVAVKPGSVSADTPAGSVHVTTGPANTPAVSVTRPTGQSSRSSASGGSPQGTTTDGSSSGPAGPGSGGGTAGGSGVPAPPAPLGTYAPAGVGYGELPPIEGAPGRRARARIARRERLLKATVERFEGCLTALPASNRELLELRTGYGDARPLSPRATAARLHVDAAQLATQEKQAVHELGAAAATHSCARTGEDVEATMALIGAGLGGGHVGRIGRTEVASFRASRPAASTPAPTLVGRILGADVPPVASDLIIVLLLGMLLGGTVVLLIADSAGHGPRHEQWRRRVINRVRAMR